jgi:hypothetical protein
MANIYAHGVPETIIENVTLSTHNWGDPASWVNGTEDSTFEISPESGELMVLRECLIKFSSGMKFDSSNALVIEAKIETGGDPIVVPITRYNGVSDFIKRADRVEIIDLMADGGDITHPIAIIRLFFAKQIILWSTPGQDKLGETKFQSLVARIDNHQPFKMHDNAQPEIAICRYFMTRHSEADVIE